MRITGTGPQNLPGATASAETAADLGAPAVASAAATILQSAVLQPALAALRDMPEIDPAAVKTLRDALAKGEVPFDAGRLAGLIERYHGKSK
ncbi:hypothetical protein [Dechloromonas denitrificans]|uniref:hypothetical protein n=1 Tax=Dechloromonas denitrificans TaxID=281362 RepID=UPI001CFA74C5|nr:hypothetical protein [Dechloromonas denitrificans]UCV08966.1 flagellar biosynthesis anti-sigma factor FlgM [Dechloromonas denitrificans]